MSTLACDSTSLILFSSIFASTKRGFRYTGVLLTVDKQPDSFYTMHKVMSERLSSLLYHKKEGFLLQVWRCYHEKSSHYSPTFVHVSVGTSSWWLYFLVNYSFSEQSVSHIIFPTFLCTLHLITISQKKKHDNNNNNQTQLDSHNLVTVFLRYDCSRNYSQNLWTFLKISLPLNISTHCGIVDGIRTRRAVWSMTPYLVCTVNRYNNNDRN